MKHIFCTSFVFLLFVAGAQAEEVSAVVELKGHTDLVVFTLYSPDETKITTGSCDKTARIWDVESGKELYKSEGKYGKFFPDGKKIALNGKDGNIRILDVESGKELQKLYLKRRGIARFRTTGI